MGTTSHDGRKPLGTQVERGSSILLLAPSLHSSTGDGCLELLSLDDPTDENVLWVTYTRSPDACTDDWLDHAGQRPRNMRVLSIGDSTRSASAQHGGTENGGATVQSVSNPSDLTGLGIEVSEVLKRWNANDYQSVACFDSLTALLQYADVDTVYRFLHVVTGRFRSAGVTAHFHLDPNACDTQTVNTLMSLFDSVVEFDDGEWTVRSR